MIEFIKDNQWFFGIVTAIEKRRIRLSETNKKIFNDTLKSKHSDLFKYTNSSSDSFPLLQLQANGFDPKEILLFCYKVIDFKDEGNRFKGLRTNCKFNRMYKVARQIAPSSGDTLFHLRVKYDSDNTYLKFFEDNENDINKLEKLYKKFYLSIFDNL